jgi:hypothetical protein
MFGKPNGRLENQTTASTKLNRTEFESHSNASDVCEGESKEDSKKGNLSKST